jgi:glycosyltransferase involved in cell wall biosynthesis
MSRRPPTIAIVTDSILPYHRGGKEVRTYEVTRRLAERAEVHVYTMRWWDTPGTHIQDGVTFHALCRRIPLYEGERRSTRQAVVFALACLRLATRRFSVIEADCIPYLHVFTLRLVATLRRKRLVVTWHEVWGPEYWRQYLGRRGRVAWWIERAAMRLPDEIIAVSEETGRRLHTHLGDSVPLTVAPNGIDVDAVQRAPLADDPATLVVVGRLLANKRVDLLLDSVALLHAQGIMVTCRVIGDGPERESLQAHATTLGIAGAVDFRVDVVDQATLYSLMKASRVFVSPSEREGFGIAVLEALACGLPVVTTSAPDNLAAQLVLDSLAGIVCDPTCEAVADAVLSVLAHPRTADIDDRWLRAHDWDAASQLVLAALLK